MSDSLNEMEDIYDTAEEIGFLIGQTAAKLINPVVGVTTLFLVREILVETSANHAIDSNDIDAVSENLFDCLQYID